MNNRGRVISFFLAVIHFIITFSYQTKFYTHTFASSEHMVSFVLLKVILFLVLVLLWQGAYELIVAKNQVFRNVFKYAMMYFIPLMLLLFLIWPGPIADGDLPYFLINEKAYSYDYYLHYLVSLVHHICLMLIPIISGILIVQGFLYSLIVGYIVYRFKNRYPSKWVYTFYLIFLIPSLCFYSLYINRTPLYSYIYLFFLSILVFDHLDQKELHVRKALLLIALGSILVVLRYEGIYLLLFLPIFTCIGYKLPKDSWITKRKLFLILFVSMLIGTTLMNIPQKKWENAGGDNYTYARLKPFTVHSLSNMLNYPKVYEYVSQKEVYIKIDKVMSVEGMKEDAKLNFIGPIVSADRGNYSAEDFNIYTREALKTIISFPLEFSHMKLRLFLSTALYSYDSNQNLEEFAASKLTEYDFVKPLFPNIRKRIVPFLGNTINKKGITVFRNPILTRVYDFIGLLSFNLFIPIVMLGGLIVYSLLKKKWLWLWMFFGLITHGCIVGALAPAAYYMYYIPLEYVTWFFVITVFIEEMKNRSINSETRKLVYQGKSFIIFSAIGWVIDFTIYTIITYLFGKNVGIANIISGIPAITFVFITSTRATFKNKESQYTLKQKYLLYVIYQIILIGIISCLNLFLYNTLVDFFVLRYEAIEYVGKILSKLLITPITLVMNFIVMKNIIEKI